MTYDILKKEKILTNLETQEQELVKRLDDTKELEDLKVQKQKELEEWEEQIEVAEHRNECLTHMKELKKVTFRINYYV